MREVLKFLLKMIIITLAALFVAQATAQSYDVDPPLQRYVDEYIEIMELNDIQIPQQVRFMVKYQKKSLPRGAAGAAWGMFKRNMVMVAVDPDAVWLSHNQMRWLMFHELTHDIWDIKHESGLKLMFPIIPDYVSRPEVDKAICEVANYLKNR